MAVYVRLSHGAEDTISAYTGCAKCARPFPNTSQTAELRCNTYRTCSCGHTESRTYDDDYTGFKRFDWIPLRWWNPAVERDDNGGLMVKKYGEEVAYYPSGAWMSYRSD